MRAHDALLSFIRAGHEDDRGLEVPKLDHRFCRPSLLHSTDSHEGERENKGGTQIKTAPGSTRSTKIPFFFMYQGTTCQPHRTTVFGEETGFFLPALKRIFCEARNKFQSLFSSLGQYPLPRVPRVHVPGYA